MGTCQLPKIIIGNKNTEQGSIQIYGKDADVLILGDATHEGGDVSIYRDGSGNKQVSIDADAASNAKAVDIYGGVVIQNYLTLGQTALDTNRTFTCVGNGKVTGILLSNELRVDSLIRTILDNAPSIRLNIPVIGTDSTDHALKLQIDENDIIVAQATGDGAGGIVNKKALFYAPIFHADTPQTLTGAGAVNITTSITHLVTTGADALTLADGAEGQIKYIVMKTDGGNGTLTPAHFANGTTLTFDAVGDSVMLLFTNGAWHWMGGQATIGA